MFQTVLVSGIEVGGGNVESAPLVVLSSNLREYGSVRTERSLL